MKSDLERCMDLSAPFLPIMHEAWHAAFDKYRKTDAELRSEYDDTTVANVVRAHMWHEVQARFQGRPGCATRSISGLKLLFYKDLFVWRFKQVNGRGRHSNVQTKQQRDFDLRLPLPGIPPPATRLTSGYQPDASGESIERIVVSRPYGKSVDWVAQVNVIDKKATWIEITPRRFAGTETFHRKGNQGGRQ
jgi:hypothetical protein